MKGIQNPPTTGIVGTLSNNLTSPMVLNSLTEGVIVADPAGRFVFFNTAAERILGLGSLEIPPDEWSLVYGCYQVDRVTLYPPRQLPLLRAIYGEVVTEEIIFIKNPAQPDGVWISVSGSPVYSADGKIEGGVVIIRDITEHRNTLEQKERLALAVEQLSLIHI